MPLPSSDPVIPPTTSTGSSTPLGTPLTPVETPSPKERLQAFTSQAALWIKLMPWTAAVVGIGLAVAVTLGVWYLRHSRVAHEESATEALSTPNPQGQGQVAQPAPQQAPQVSSSSREVTEAPARPSGKTNPQSAGILQLKNLARDAYAKGHYAIPVDTSAITYSKRALGLDPSSEYSKTLLENSVTGGKYQAQQAIKHKDFATAHRIANAMGQLLPGRRDIAELKTDINIAEKGTSASRRRSSVATVSFPAYHIHNGKAPADGGSYCLGVLNVTGQHLRFTGRSASRSQKVHTLDFACSDLREIKKNTRIASHQGGFHVRTDSGSTNFAPRDSSPTHISALASACSK